jgi:hypothetical protein
MSAEPHQAAATSRLLNGRYEGLQPDCLASFLGAPSQLVPLLEDLHCRLSTAFPGTRCMLRHLASPRVPSPEGDGHRLVVVVPAAPTGDASSLVSDLLRQWAPQAAARAFSRWMSPRPWSTPLQAMRRPLSCASGGAPMTLRTLSPSPVVSSMPRLVPTTGPWPAPSCPRRACGHRARSARDRAAIRTRYWHASAGSGGR